MNYCYSQVYTSPVCFENTAWKIKINLIPLRFPVLSPHSHPQVRVPTSLTQDCKFCDSIP